MSVTRTRAIRIRRFTIEELKAEARDSFEPFALQPEYDGANTTDLVLAWLDWLGKEQA